jgi:hypothetical protein
LTHTVFDTAKAFQKWPLVNGQSQDSLYIELHNFENSEQSELGLKRNPLFSFSRKAKISENSLTFSENSLCENFRFREKFLFPEWFSRKVSVFAKDFAKSFSFRPLFCKYICVLEAFRQKRNLSNDY